MQPEVKQFFEKITAKTGEETKISFHNTYEFPYQKIQNYKLVLLEIKSKFPLTECEISFYKSGVYTTTKLINHIQQFKFENGFYTMFSEALANFSINEFQDKVTFENKRDNESTCTFYYQFTIEENLR